MRSSMPRNASGSIGLRATEIDSGRPDRSTIRRSVSNSSSTSRKSDTTCSTPVPAAPTPSAMPISSSRRRGQRRGVRLAVDGPVVEGAARGEAEGAGLDALPRRVRPSATMSSAVASSWFAPALAHHVQPQRARAAPGRRRRCRAAARRRRRGSRRTSSSSTPAPRGAPRPGCPRRLPSARSACRGRRSCTGAKPTPQLPITTVVTPCHDEGCSRLSHVAWPS